MQIYRLGHNGLFYFSSARRQTLLIEPPGIGLGIAENDKFMDNLHPQEIHYQTGDIFLFLTDGLLKPWTKKGKPLVNHV
jgi:hypothetical protein